MAYEFHRFSRAGFLWARGCQGASEHSELDFPDMKGTCTVRGILRPRSQTSPSSCLDCLPLLAQLPSCPVRSCLCSFRQQQRHRESRPRGLDSGHASSVPTPPVSLVPPRLFLFTSTWLVSVGTGPPWGLDPAGMIPSSNHSAQAKESTSYPQQGHTDSEGPLEGTS